MTRNDVSGNMKYGKKKIGFFFQILWAESVFGEQQTLNGRILFGKSKH
jgi:hypothetical protein